MLLTERHIITRENFMWKEIDKLSDLSKHFYNKVHNIIVSFRQEQNRLPNISELYAQAKQTEEYYSLPTKVSVQLLNQFLGNWYYFLKACKSYREDSSQFEAPPRPPSEKKPWQRSLLIYPLDAISKTAFRDGIVFLSKSNIWVKTKQKEVKHIRIIPKRSHYAIEVVYKVDPKVFRLDLTLVSGIDLGVNTLAALTSNKSGFQPNLINGKPLKSMNQFYNKTRSHLLSRLGRYANGKRKKNSRRLEILELKRNNKIEDYIHKASRYIINHLVSNGIGTLVIGYNEGWKQNSNIGKRNNQNFCSIPFYKFVSMLAYKAELAGIVVIHQEESYTSKCSFLDNEELCHHESYIGRRVKRGLFISSTGIKINADINGSYNIIRKAIPNAFGKRDRGCVVHPTDPKPNFGFHRKSGLCNKST